VNKQNNMTEYVELFDRSITEELSSLYNFPNKPLYYPDRMTTVAHKIMNHGGDVCEEFNKFAQFLRPFSQWL
jgi:hypothetical protein